jgi:hypothetical protein
MAIPLDDAIALATEPVEASALISMHDDLGVVLVGGATLTFRPDLPLLNWGTGTIAGGGASSKPVIAGWFKYQGQVPGFSSRGVPGTNQLEWKGANQPLLSFDFSVRRDPGYGIFGRFGWGPSIQIEIELLDAAGAVTDGFQLNATQDGTLLRAMGPSLWPTGGDPASYTVGLSVIRIADLPQ